MTEKQYTKALAKVVSYLTSRGYTVKLDSNTFGFFEEDDLITAPTKSQGTLPHLCSLLHEAGHTVQDRSQFNSLRRTTKRDQAIIIEQEYTAWYHGLELARELNIYTKEQVNKMRKAGIKVLGYFVCEDINSSWIGRSKDQFRKMYGNESEFIDINSLTQLSNSLNKLFVRK